MADFVKVMEERKRMCDYIMCNYIRKCGVDCGLSAKANGKDLNCEDFCSQYPQEAEEIIMAWAKEHPKKTNADKFKEVFGFEPSSRCPFPSTQCLGHRCEECEKYNFWKQEYKEPSEV